MSPTTRESRQNARNLANERNFTVTNRCYWRSMSRSYRLTFQISSHIFRLGRKIGNTRGYQWCRISRSTEYLHTYTAPDTKEYATFRCNGIIKLIDDDLSEVSAQMIQFMYFLRVTRSMFLNSSAFLTVYKQEIQDDLILTDLPIQSFVNH